MNKIAKITKVEDLKSFEKISQYVSEQYVPLYTSEIVKELEGSFEFESAVRYCDSGTMHSVTLVNREGDRIHIDNSYDRSRAFSLRFTDGQITIPLDLDKVVHRGTNAKELIDNIHRDKNSIVEALQDAKTTVLNLKETKITKEFKEAIIAVIFKDVLVSKEVDITIADSYDTFYEYIHTVTDRFLKGEYHTVGRNDKSDMIRKGRVIKSRFRRLDVTLKVYKFLKSNVPELFI